MISIDELIQRLDPYKAGEVDRRPKKKDFYYKNDYIHCIRLDSSNHYVSSGSLSMDKQWSIIFKKEKDFSLEIKSNISRLQARCDFSITPVRTGENIGCFGFRFYHMAKNPDEPIVKQILDFIFQGKPSVPTTGPLSSKLIGATIVHPTFGHGVVIEIENNNTLHVRFENGVIKLLSYNWCIQNKIIDA